MYPRWTRQVLQKRNFLKPELTFNRPLCTGLGDWKSPSLYYGPDGQEEFCIVLHKNGGGSPHDLFQGNQPTIAASTFVYPETPLYGGNLCTCRYARVGSSDVPLHPLTTALTYNPLLGRHGHRHRP